jgi:hypothetical protein
MYRKKIEALTDPKEEDINDLVDKTLRNLEKYMQ